jgi:cutinase
MSTLVPIAPSSAASTCSDYAFLGARGSGEPSLDEDPTLFGLGGELKGTYDKISVMVIAAGKTMSEVPVDFPAVPIDGSIPAWLTAAGAVTGLGTTYRNSVNEGSEAAISEVEAIRAACPDTQIILGGYSQGAQALDGALQTMSAADKGAVVSVLLFGDPKFNGDDSKADLGGYDPNHYGLFAPPTLSTEFF